MTKNIKILVLFLIVFISSCSHIDYMIQKPVELDKSQVDSTLKVVIKDDEVKRDRIFPDSYLYVFVDDYLVVKDYKSMTKKDRYIDKFYCSFDKTIMIKQGKHRVKVKYQTYRNSEPVVLYHEKDVELKPNKIVTFYFNKKFSVRESDK